MGVLFKLDPLEDARWNHLVKASPNASVFHTPEWLRALRRTHGYEPVVFTTSGPGGRLRNGWVFCRVNSWITGRRLVSLPFSDHCEPLASEEGELAQLLASLKRLAGDEGWSYIEVRPPSSPGAEVVPGSGFRSSETFYLHRLDLRRPLDQIHGDFHKSCIRRKIQRAEREKLGYERGRTESILDRFYQLYVLTRRRHRLPPQSIQWLRNLIHSLGEKAVVHLALHKGRPAAGILTLLHNRTLVYKYGASDAELNALGGTPFLLWKAIREAKERGLEEFDMGRSALGNRGLVTFKDRWGARRLKLTYYRYPAATRSFAQGDWVTHMAGEAFSHLPPRLLAGAGRLLYRHFG